MRRLKKFAALGLSCAMISSMAVGVSAAENKIEDKAAGKATVESKADIDVDGYITKDAVIDTSGNPIDPSLPTYSESHMASTVGPTQNVSNGQTITTDVPTMTATSNLPSSWGDVDADSTNLLITAPTKLSFFAAGDGEDANIQLTSEGLSVKGKIYNQSCYVSPDGDVIPKEVAVTGQRNDPTTKEFELVAADGTFSEGTNAVKGVHLQVRGMSKDDDSSAIAGSDRRYDFAKLNAATDLGYLAAGTRSIAGNEQAVNPSMTELSFTDADGKATGVSTQFAGNYDDGQKLHTSYKLSLTYSVDGARSNGLSY